MNRDMNKNCKPTQKQSKFIRGNFVWTGYMIQRKMEWIHARIHDTSQL